MLTDAARQELSEICVEFSFDARKSLKRRLGQWRIDLMREQVFCVVGGLLSRQVTLVSKLYCTPSNWNNHIAPMFFRSIVDVFINLSWILKSPDDRSRMFIEYGLGQAVLQNEHRKAWLLERGASVEDDLIYEATAAWIWAQKVTHTVDVNIGAWSETNTRRMADEAGCKSLYDFAYVPFSACTHSTWQHISQFNLIASDNPLHRFAQVPSICDDWIDPMQLVVPGRYLQRTFEEFDAWAGISSASDDEPYKIFIGRFTKWMKDNAPDRSEEFDPTA